MKLKNAMALGLASVLEDHDGGGFRGVILGGDVDPPVAHGAFVDFGMERK